MSFMVPENASEHRNEILKAINGTVRNDVPFVRIPVYSNIWTWKICDAGCKISEAVHDYDMMYDVVCRHHEKYNFDFYIDLGTRNPIMMAEAAGTCSYEFDDEKNTIYILDREKMLGDEYPQLIEDGLTKFCFEKVLPRIGGYSSKEEMFKKIGEAAVEQNRYNEYSKKITNQYVNVYGVPTMAAGRFSMPSDTLFNYLRGMKAASIDLRRNEGYILQALETINEGRDVHKVFSAILNADQYCFGVRIVSLGHNFLNAKQYEKFVMPYMKQCFESIVENDLTGFLWNEGTSAHILDFYRDLPSGHFAFLGELDDIRMLKKRLPNLTLVGGMDDILISKGSPDQCVDYVKALINDIGYDGKYIFANNKMLSYANDAKAENLLAVIDYIRTHGSEI